MRTCKVLVRVAGLVACLSIFASVSWGTKDIAKKEKKPCTTCHVKAGSKELNDVGNCYKKNGNSLKGCEAKKGTGKSG